MEIPENYRGREQALVKHRLLEAYLERLFMIIGLHQSDIRYVDCFSGPWQEEGDDLEGTSIAVALRIMKKCHAAFLERKRDVRFHALFIEKDPQAFQRLRDFLGQQTSEGVQTKALPGVFFNLRQSILDWCGPRDFTFFFIDPFGWKKVIQVPTLKPLLRRPNSEFLINFMYDFLLRTHTQEAF
jgi:three-Cys-motif partner protein